jgi:CAAX protease family protein
MRVFIALLPMLILLSLALISCVLSYVILLAMGDVLELGKLISKSTLVLLLLSIFPIKAWLNLTWADLGFSPAKQFIKQMSIGVLLGVVTLLPILLLLYGLDVHIIDSGKDWTLFKAAKKISIALLLALLISFAEEPLFRGVLLSAFKRKMAVSLAIVLSSLYYASLHFLKGKTDVPYEQLTLGSGFPLMAEAFSNWLNSEIIGALVALLTVGIFLAVIRVELKNSLGICVGCHAGWVWQIKVSKDFLNVNPHSDWLFLVSSYDGVVGPLVTAWLTLAIVGFYSWKAWHKRMLNRESY